MAFVTRVPRGPLGESVAFLWDWRVTPGEFRFERILPQPGSSLIVNLLEDETRIYAHEDGGGGQRLAGTVYSGQFTRSFVIDTHEQVDVMGVVFHPGGAHACLRDRADLYGNRHVAAEDLFGSAIGALRARLLEDEDANARLATLEAWLRARWREPRAAVIHPAVKYLLEELAQRPGVARIGALAADCGISLRRLDAVFREQVGVTPKAFARLQRFRAAIGGVGRDARIDWAHIAADGGFADQSHLVREFQAFAGMSPTAYVRRRGVHVNHVGT
jgi:methylphosphotriester-DNA--protein-cysteine methyltransferase